ncbi:rhamnan synthesis F family protein [Tateyamaria sp.]|uniref:rhamnan synthesis F family protein n=2 Tax=Tateyamaria sp. TaxID=1929288 RepID=UPI0032DCDA4E
MFPRDGLLASHKLAIKYLIDNGYAPLVVSNLPLGDKDKAWLTEHTYKFISRPNRGYDFGGYREAFLTLGADAKQLDYLAFFNDSVWFPVPGAENWLQQAEALNVDCAATVSSFGIPKVDFDRFRDIRWTVDTNLRNFHYASFALLVGRNVLQSRAYQRYWKRIPLSAQKNRVVRVGEIGMTRFILRSGFTHGTTYDLITYDLMSLPAALNRMSDEQINQIARNLVTLGTELATRTLDATLSTLDATRSQKEREDSIQLILTVTARIGIAYVLPGFLYKNYGFNFLKKSPLGMNRSDSDIMLELGKILAGPDGRIIEEEMLQIRQSKGIEGVTDKTSVAPMSLHKE